MTVSRPRRAWIAGLALALAAGAVSAALPARAEEPVVVFAAASLKNALDEASAAWTKETGKTSRISYAGSNALAKQIESGAPADLFFSADLAWMDYAEKNGTIRPETRTNLLRNAIVLVARRGRTPRLPWSRASTSPRPWPAGGSPWGMSKRCRRASTGRRRWKSSARGTA